eukprot:scaffold2393_cov288-Chaetoceros_neogracile.AAC.2
MMSVPIVQPITHTTKTMKAEEDHGFIVFSRQNGSDNLDDLSTVSCLTESSLDIHNAKKRTRTNSFQFTPNISEQCINCACACADPFASSRMRVLSPIPIPFMNSPEKQPCAQECNGRPKSRRKLCHDQSGATLAMMNNTTSHALGEPNGIQSNIDGIVLKRSPSIEKGMKFQENLCQEIMTHSLPIGLVYREHQALTAQHNRTELSNVLLNQTMLKVPNPLEPEPIPVVIQIITTPPVLAVHADTDDISELGIDDQDESPAIGIPSFPALGQTVESHIDDQCVKNILDMIPSTISPPPPNQITVGAVLVTPSVD